MNRRNFIQNSALTFGALAMSNEQVLAKILAQNAYQISSVRGNVSIFNEKGGTIGYLKTKEGFIVVDAQFPDTAEHLITELKKTTEPIKLLINTHHHFDHTSGNIAFKGLVQHVVAHENSLKNQEAVAKKNNTEAKELFPDVTFAETWKHRVGNESIRAHYFGAGHTNGDALIHFEHANVLHMGDLIFNRKYPYIDKSAGANIKSWISVLDKTLKTFDEKTIFIFGHALEPHKTTGNKDDIRAFQNYLEKLLTFTESEIKAGKSKEEIMKATSIKGATEWQGEGIVRSLEAAYTELTLK